MLPAAAYADTADGESLIGKPWDEITALAKGGEVNWFLWGGSDNINQYVTEFVGGILKDQYDITLNRVGLSDTVEAVNIVLGEKESGVTDKGSVDMIWINGENFRTMKQGGLAYCGYTDTLPNNNLIDWDNPAIANDLASRSMAVKCLGQKRNLHLPMIRTAWIRRRSQFPNCWSG